MVEGLKAEERSSDTSFTSVSSELQSCATKLKCKYIEYARHTELLCWLDCGFWAGQSFPVVIFCLIRRQALL